MGKDAGWINYGKEKYSNMVGHLVHNSNLSTTQIDQKALGKKSLGRSTPSDLRRKRIRDLFNVFTNLGFISFIR